MLTVKDVMEMGARYGEELDRSQVDKWLKGVNSSKAVRVMLAMMEAEMTGNTIRATFEKPEAVVEIVPEPIRETVADMIPEDYGMEEVAMAKFKYEAPGAEDGWKWDGRQLQVCYREQVYACKEYVEIGRCVSLEGDLIRLDFDGRFLML